MNQDTWKQQRLNKWTTFQQSHLEKWLPIALEWKLYEDGTHRRCFLCSQNIWFTHDQYGEEYNYGADEILALIIAHVRQVHAQEADARSEMPLQAMQESGNESEV